MIIIKILNFNHNGNLGNFNNNFIHIINSNKM